jgi:hypothetical protein
VIWGTFMRNAAGEPLWTRQLVTERCEVLDFAGMPATACITLSLLSYPYCAAHMPPESVVVQAGENWWHVHLHEGTTLRNVPVALLRFTSVTDFHEDAEDYLVDRHGRVWMGHNISENIVLGQVRRGRIETREVNDYQDMEVLWIDGDLRLVPHSWGEYNDMLPASPED